MLSCILLTLVAGGAEITLETPLNDVVGNGQTCAVLLDRYRAAEPPHSTPPRNMPKEQLERFTMGGTIAVGEMFVDDTLGGKGSHYQFPAGDVDHMVNSAASMLKPGSRGRRRLASMDQWLFSALDEHSISGGHVAIFGSMSPWYEAIAVAAGAEAVTTLEYNKLTYDHPKMHTATPAEVELPAGGGFDFAFSISSFDHDGLGRYGDPVHPDGDLLAMRTAMCMLRPGGLLFLSVPVGPDVVVWNLHRRYGEVRLPHLLYGWDVLDVVGWNQEKLTADANWRRSYEPIFVLRAPAARDEL